MIIAYILGLIAVSLPLFCLLAVMLIRMRSYIYSSEQNFGKTYLFLIAFQFLLLFFACLLFYSNPYVLTSTREPGGGYLITNPGISPLLIISMAFALFTSFPTSNSLEKIKSRIAYSLAALIVLPLFFYPLIIAISPSDKNGFICFGLLCFSCLVFAITGFKTTELSNFQKLISIISLPVYYIITYILFLRQLSVEDYNYYFEKLGGTG